MGVAAVPSSASRSSPFGLAAGCGGGISSQRSLRKLRRPFAVVAFKGGHEWSSLVTTTPEVAGVVPEVVKEAKRSSTRSAKKSRIAKAVSADAAPSAAKAASPSSVAACPPELDLNEVAAALENIYKLSPADVGGRPKRGGSGGENVVRNPKKRTKRLSLQKRVVLKQKNKEEATGIVATGEREEETAEDEEDVEKLVREYSASTDVNSFDWKKMKIPPVLGSGEQARLFKLMQPMKALVDVKENLNKDLNREPTDVELVAVTNMSVQQLRRHIKVGQAARNKLIKHNLRLALFVINKYYPEIANGQKFQDLCQAGAKGLITSIDRFEPKRGFRLSTYSLFWIRHSIIRSTTLSSFTKVPFGIESVRQEIQKAKLELTFELGRQPTEEEITQRVGISPERFHDVVKTSKPVLSLHARHTVTQEEFIKGITDMDTAGGDKRRQPALLRLALDDVLDSLRPKESLVIRQRYGLDGKGDRTLGEIAGNLNISREMVRKHEMKALLKLKHPARLDYLRRYVR